MHDVHTFANYHICCNSDSGSKRKHLINIFQYGFNENSVWIWLSFFFGRSLNVAQPFFHLTCYAQKKYTTEARSEHHFINNYTEFRSSWNMMCLCWNECWVNRIFDSFDWIRNFFLFKGNNIITLWIGTRLKSILQWHIQLIIMPFPIST